MDSPRASNFPLIQVEDLCKTYTLGNSATGTVDSQVLFDINLVIQRGEFVAIMGHSGSGKSTLMNMLGCLDTPTSGYYWLDGQNTSSLSDDDLARVRNRNLGFVFQGFRSEEHTSELQSHVNLV